jgi:hypothetical protein
MSDTSSIDELKCPREEMNEIIAKAPFMRSIEYLNEETARTRRVCFHLTENKNNADFPFTFLVTYTTNLSRTAHAWSK